MAVVVLEGLGDQLGPVADRTSEEAAVDQVEPGVVVPVGFEVIDEELDVWRDAGCGSVSLVC